MCNVRCSIARAGTDILWVPPILTLLRRERNELDVIIGKGGIALVRMMPIKTVIETCFKEYDGLRCAGNAGEFFPVESAVVARLRAQRIAVGVEVVAVADPFI